LRIFPGKNRECTQFTPKLTGVPSLPLRVNVRSARGTPIYATTPYNDPKQHHGIREWAAFYGSVIMAGSAWLPLYLVFKICEKKLVDAGVRSTQ
jgi:hypothetical protein